MRTVVRTTLGIVPILLCLSGCSGGRAPLAPLPIGPIFERVTPAPEATFTVSPNRIRAGEKAELKWSTVRADEVVLDPGPGSAPLSGVMEVSPSATTDYTLWVRGPGGESTATARLVVEPAADAASLVDPGDRFGGPSSSRMFSGTFGEEVSRRLRDVHFDYDAAGLTPDQMRTLDENAEVIQALFREFGSGTIIVEGHCDERGSNEYNLALGDGRARASVDYLASRGVDLARLMLVSYGEEQPQCTQAAEQCWKLNRRAHFAAR